jgi:hypothetical protein
MCHQLNEVPPHRRVAIGNARIFAETTVMVIEVTENEGIKKPDTG